MHIQTSHHQSTLNITPQNTQTSYHQSIQPTHAFQTPQEQLLRFRNDSMSQFNQSSRPHITQATKPNYDNMSTKFDYDNANYWGDMIENLLDMAGPSYQPALGKY